MGISAGSANRPHLPLSQLMEEAMDPWEQLAWPTIWDELFTRKAPLVLEIGFGNGDFLVEMAKRQPEKNYIGIEVSWTSIQHLLKRIDQTDLPPIRVLQGDAVALLECLFASNTIDEIYVNHPDPWRKERHWSRRFIQSKNVALLADRLKPQGRLTIATDHQAYSEWISDVLTGQSDLVSEYAPKAEVSDLPERIRTKYEMKARAQGIPIHYFVWKKERPPAHEFLAPKEYEMPHVILKVQNPALGLEQVFSDMDPDSWQETHRGVLVVVKVVEAYHRAGSRDGLVEVLVKEGNLTQHFGITIAFRQSDELLVKLSSMGHPRPTYGVKQAVWNIARLLTRKRADLTVLSSTVGPLHST